MYSIMKYHSLPYPPSFYIHIDKNLFSTETENTKIIDTILFLKGINLKPQSIDDIINRGRFENTEISEEIFLLITPYMILKEL